MTVFNANRYVSFLFYLAEEDELLNLDPVRPADIYSVGYAMEYLYTILEEEKSFHHLCFGHSSEFGQDFIYTVGDFFNRLDADYYRKKDPSSYETLKLFIDLHLFVLEWREDPSKTNKKQLAKLDKVLLSFGMDEVLQCFVDALRHEFDPTGKIWKSFRMKTIFA